MIPAAAAFVGNLKLIRSHATRRRRSWQMTVYSYRSNEVQFNESDKVPMAEAYPKDVVDSSIS
jgi:hypothetical protein